MNICEYTIFLRIGSLYVYPQFLLCTLDAPPRTHGGGTLPASHEVGLPPAMRYACCPPRGIPIISKPFPRYPKIRLLVPSVEVLKAPIQRTRGVGGRNCCAKRGAAGGESNRRRVGRGSLALAGNPMHDLSRREALHQASLHVVHIGSDV